MTAGSTLKLIAVFLIAALASPAAQAHGKREVLLKLLEQQERPSVQKVVELYGIPSRNRENPMADFGYTGQRSRARMVRQWLPKAIARLELAFPNGIFAPMGRDSAAIGDVLEAFYLQIGQTDRVSRIHASGNTIRSIGAADIVRLLESAGAVLDVRRPSPRTLVLFDATNYNYGSQSTRLLMAATQAVLGSGGNGADVIERVNFVSTTRNMHRGVSITSPGQVQSMKRRQAESIVRPDDRPIVVPGIGMSFLNYTAEWHGAFGSELVEFPDGRLGGYLDSRDPASRYQQGRIQILGAIFDYLRVTSDPQFVNDVVEAARKLGIEFSRSGPSLLECKSILENAA